MFLILPSPVTVRLSVTSTVPPAESRIRFPEEVSISVTPLTPNWMFLILPFPITIRLSSTSTVPPAESRIRFPVKVSISVLFDTVLAILTFLILANPEITTSSLISTVPAKESKIKFPVIVSIVLLLSTAILTCSNFAPSKPVTSPFTSRVPDIVTLSLISTVPASESIIRFPTEVSIVLSSETPILIFLDIAAPSACISAAKVVPPVINKLSSTLTVPPAESRIRFPVVVSISLFPPIPILILSIIAPPVPVNRPPLTIVKLSSTSTVPPAESRIRFPVEVSIVLSDAMPILTLSIVAPPSASRRPVKVLIPVTLRFLPTIRSFEIATPPLTIRAADDNENASVVSSIVTIFPNLVEPSTLKSCLILTELLNVTGPFSLTSPLNVTGPSN